VGHCVWGPPGSVGHCSAARPAWYLLSAPLSSAVDASSRSLLEDLAMDELTRLLANEDESGLLPVGIELEDKLFVSKQVLDGSPVLSVFRDEPTHGDSGWVLLAGNEPESWFDDIKRFQEQSVDWALEFDPTLRSILGAPADSSFERDAIGQDWAELEEG